MNVTNSQYFTFNVNNSLLLVGPTGTGKTEFVRKYLRRLEAGFTPEQMKYAIFDMKVVEFDTKYEEGAKKEYLYCDVVTDAVKGLDVLEELATLSDERISKQLTTPFIFVYIEECDMACVDQARFDDAVIKINQNAKVANMKLIYSTSRPAKDTISKALLHSFELLLAAHLASDADYEYLEIPKVQLTAPFDFSLTERSIH